MRRAIKFDNQATFRTIKVDNIATNTCLPAELLPEEPALLKLLPQDGFGRCQGSAKFRAWLPHRGRVVDATLALAHGGVACKLDAKLTTPSAPSSVAFGAFFLMAQPPLLFKEGNKTLPHLFGRTCLSVLLLQILARARFT